MIRIFNAASTPRRDLDAMYRGRKRVFADRLEWAVSITDDGRELDQFDACDPFYLLAYDSDKRVQGSMRLMPTTGPTLLTSVFGETFDEPVDIRSAGIWEVTRFCVHPEAGELTPTRMNRATAELCQGLAELALDAGLSHVIGIYDERMVRVYNRIGWAPERLATSLPGRSETLHVGMWEVSRSALLAMQARSGLVEAVLESLRPVTGERKAG